MRMRRKLELFGPFLSAYAIKVLLYHSCFGISFHCILIYFYYSNRDITKQTNSVD